MENVKSGAFALIFAKCWPSGTTRFPAIRSLFALVRLPKNQPKAMLTPGVVRVLPFRGNDRPLSDLDDAVTGREADLGCSLNQFNVCPLEAVPMHIVGNLAEQDALGFEDTISFSNKFRVQMGEVISICCRRLDDETESAVEILRLVLALIGYVGRIVDNDIKRAVLERHVAVIADHVRVKLRVNVQTHDLSFAALPESPNIYCRIQNRLGPFSWIKVEHHL